MNLYACAKVPMTKMPTTMAIHLELLDSGTSWSCFRGAGLMN